MTDAPTMSTPPDAGSPAWGSRQVYWYETGGFVDTPVLRLTEGGVPDRLEGPLLIELPDTVVVVRPGQGARFGELGSLVIDL